MMPRSSGGTPYPKKNLPPFHGSPAGAKETPVHGYLIVRTIDVGSDQTTRQDDSLCLLAQLEMGLPI